MYGSPVGNTTITSTTQVVPTTYHGRVFGINFLAAGTGTTIKIRNNGATGTILLQEQSTASAPLSKDYGVNGYEFSNGIYVEFDAQTSRATISYRQEESNLGL